MVARRAHPALPASTGTPVSGVVTFCNDVLTSDQGTRSACRRWKAEIEGRDAQAALRTCSYYPITRLLSFIVYVVANSVQWNVRVTNVTV